MDWYCLHVLNERSLNSKSVYITLHHNNHLMNTYRNIEFFDYLYLSLEFK